MIFVPGVPFPVPLLITPVIVLSGRVTGSAGSSFAVDHTYTASGNLGFSRAAGGAYTRSANMTTSNAALFRDAQSELDVTLSAPNVEIKFMFYSVAGPSFDLGLGSIAAGRSAIAGTPPVEGVSVILERNFVVNGGLKAGLDFSSFNVDLVKRLLGNVSVEYTPVSLRLFEKNLDRASWFFPYSGAAAVTVRDNGNVPDDIFEVALDGVVLGRTTKGGSGQFRLRNLRPGSRTLTITTVEDDSPPGTYEVALGNGLLFSDGSFIKSGTAPLGSVVAFTLVVP